MKPFEIICVRSFTHMSVHVNVKFNSVISSLSYLFQSIVRVESPCYELEKIMFDVTSPYLEGGQFRVVIIETKASEVSQSSQSISKDKKVRPGINSLQSMSKDKKVRPAINSLTTKQHPLHMNIFCNKTMCFSRK